MGLPGGQKRHPGHEEGSHQPGPLTVASPCQSTLGMAMSKERWPQPSGLEAIDEEGTEAQLHRMDKKITHLCEMQAVGSSGTWMIPSLVNKIVKWSTSKRIQPVRPRATHGWPSEASKVYGTCIV